MPESEFWSGIGGVPVALIRRVEAGSACPCTDPVYNTPIPGCELCRGTGKVQVTRRIPVVAAIHWHSPYTIYDDDDERPTQIHAFFARDSGVTVGTIISYDGSEYAVKNCQKNNSHLDCTLEVLR